MCVLCIYIYIIHIHSTHTYIMYTIFFIWDAISRRPALIVSKVVVKFRYWVGFEMENMCFICTNKQPLDFLYSRCANKQLVKSENWSLYCSVMEFLFSLFFSLWGANLILMYEMSFQLSFKVCCSYCCVGCVIFQNKIKWTPNRSFSGILTNTFIIFRSSFNQGYQLNH